MLWSLYNFWLFLFPQSLIQCLALSRPLARVCLLMLKLLVPLVKNLPKYLLGKIWICVVLFHSKTILVILKMPVLRLHGKTIKLNLRGVGPRHFILFKVFQIILMCTGPENHLCRQHSLEASFNLFTFFSFCSYYNNSY